MTPKTRQSFHLDPNAEKALDRRVLLLCVVFWLAHLAVISSRAATGLLEFTWAASEARVVTAVVGAALCYGVYLLLKRLAPAAGLQLFARAAAASVLACALFTCANLLAFVLLVPMKQSAWADAFGLRNIVESYLYFLLEFIAWSALYATLAGSALLRDREQRLALAENAAHRAQLSALRLQIQPHFLFNTLNTLSGLIALGRAPEAEQLILNLSSLMRRTLAAAPDQMAPLSEEIRAQIMYLSIEQARFPDRLEVRCETGDDCLEAMAPAMILQPLAENAVKHGLSPSEGRVVVTLGCARRAGELELWVSNRPAPPACRASAGFGIGLNNVRERLKALFGEQARLEAGLDAEGWTSRIVLPWMSQA
jgi:sensor histidine kinase YesM